MTGGAETIRIVIDEVYSNRMMASNRELVTQPTVSCSDVKNVGAIAMLGFDLRQDSVPQVLEGSRTNAPLPLVTATQVLEGQRQIVFRRNRTAAFFLPHLLVV